MKNTSLSAAFPLAVALLFLPLTQAFPAGKYLPLVAGKPTLAMVNGKPLTLQEFERAFAEIHGGITDNAVRSRPNPSQLLDRLINAKLILQEARNIGLDELPEVTGAVRAYEEEALRGMLYGYHVRNIKKPDGKEVEKRYREAVKEIKVQSLLFDGEEAGKRLEEAVRAGGDFDGLARDALTAGEAKGSLERKYVKFESLSPEVSRAVSAMKKGEVSPLIPVGKQFSLLKLEEIRYPEDKAARDQVAKDALQAKKVAALKTYTEGLRKKYVTIDQKLVDSLDYESPESGFGKLQADDRVLAKVKGEKPVTVADLTKALEKKFFHGTDRAAERKKLNPKKDQVLEEILNKRVAIKEAKRQKLERTAYYKAKVGEYRDGILFGIFVQKVIDPEVNASDAELEAYYNAHMSDYTSPEMIRIDSLVFTGKEDGKEAIEKLRKGADFQWLRENAEGQVDALKAEYLMDFGGRMLVASDLPEGVRKAVSGAAAGDSRFYTDPGNAYYVLSIREVVPPRPMPFESVKGEIEKKVLLEKRRKVLRDWEGKLREASEIKIFATGEKLDRIVYPGAR